MCGPLAAPIMMGVSTLASGAMAMSQQNAQKKAAKQQQALAQQEMDRAAQTQQQTQAQAVSDKQAQAQAEAQRQAQIQAATKQVGDAFSGYDDNYYKGISDKYSANYLPQLDQQQQEAKKKIVYDLARKGGLDSSSSDNKFNELNNTYDNKKAEIGASALDAASQAKNRAETTKNSLIQQAQSGSGLENFGNTITSQVGGLNTVNSSPTYTPIGSVFDPILTDVGNYGVAKANGFTAVPDAMGTLFDPLLQKKKNTSVSEIK